jgi:antirestriction protein ArdC
MDMSNVKRIIALLDKPAALPGHETFMSHTVFGAAWSTSTRHYRNPDSRNETIEAFIARCVTVKEGHYENPHIAYHSLIVHMPAFAGYRSANDYYHDVFHEMVHSTDGRSKAHNAKATKQEKKLRFDSLMARMDGPNTFYVDSAGRVRRQLINEDTVPSIDEERRASPGYAREEVVAEIGAIILVDKFGLTIPDARSADYLQSYFRQWAPDYVPGQLTAKHKAAIRRAVNNAEKAVATLLNPAG